MFILGIDYGTKKVGLAIGIKESKLVFPLPRVSQTSLLEKLNKIVQEYSIELIVWGLPKYNFAEFVKSPICEEINRMAEHIYTINKIPYVYVNETLTTKAQSQDTFDKDSMSAMLILEDYINNQHIYEKNI
jgi:putative Holliday junction resolvase